MGLVWYFQMLGISFQPLFSPNRLRTNICMTCRTLRDSLCDFFVALIYRAGRRRIRRFNLCHIEKTVQFLIVASVTFKCVSRLIYERISNGIDRRIINWTACCWPISISMNFSFGLTIQLILWRKFIEGSLLLECEFSIWFTMLHEPNSFVKITLEYHSCH